MFIKRFEETDYNQLVNLWDSWKLPNTPKKWIPEDTMIIKDGEKIVCSGSLYQLGKTPMFWIEGVISNKEIDKSIRKEGLKLLINKLFDIAKEQGAEIVLSSTPRDGLKDMFLDNNFHETPEKYFHVGRFE